MIKPNEEGKSKEVQGLDKTVASIRTQMKIQQRQAQELAEAVLSALDVPELPGEGIYVRNEMAAERAYALAQDVLA